MQNPITNSLLASLILPILLFGLNPSINLNPINLCEKVKVQGDQQILCKSWQENGSTKLVVISKHRQGNDKVEFYCDIFSDEEGLKRINGIYDKIENCPVDFSIDYIQNSLTITDLDSNGLKEVTFLYALTCQGDVSPSKMKLMMLEEQKKFKLRGFRTNRATMALNEEFGYGKYTVDKSFDEAPPDFLPFAKKQWNKFKMEE